MELERKLIRLESIETKDAGEGDVAEMRFKGHGAVFGNVDSYGDVIEEGAFTKTLREAKKSGNWPAMLLQHGGWAVSSTDLLPLGVWDVLEEDKKGLVSEGVIAPTTLGKDVHTLMKMKPRPAINGLSIGYFPKKFTLGTKPEEPRRLLHEVDLLEISVVTFPANGKARVSSVKNAGGRMFTEREFEQLMQDAGLSRTEARVVIGKGFKSLLAMQDAGSPELKGIAEALQRLHQRITN